MNLNNTIELLAGGPGSGCHGPNCGRPKGHEGAHSAPGKFKVGDRVRRNPKIWKGKMGTGPENFGVILDMYEGEDNRGKKTKFYNVLTDNDVAHAIDFKKHPEKYDPIWDKPRTKGVPYTEKELVIYKR